MTEKDRNTMPRRRALQIVGFGAAGSLLAIAGCSQPPPAPAPTPPPAPTPAAPPPVPPPAAAAATGGEPTLACADKGPIDDASKQMRRALQYKEKSDSEKNCLGCVQYSVGTYGDCGGCKLFTGPVNPEGYCLSYAPKTA